MIKESRSFELIICHPPANHILQISIFNLPISLSFSEKVHRFLNLFFRGTLVDADVADIA